MSRTSPRSLIYLIARIQKKLRLSAIRDSKVHPTSAIEGGSQVVGCSMDRHSFCGYNCVLLNADIGGFCSISDNVYIGGSTHPMEFVSTSPVFLSHRDSVRTKFSRHEYYHMPRTTVGHDVWIGHGVHIRAGVSIGHGAVIGMGAVVTRDVAPYTVVGGNPAWLIRDRFEPRITKALLASEWWDMPDDNLRAAAADFTDPETFLHKIGLI
jgi:chloramphenicol O-acetyltransferase type B